MSALAGPFCEERVPVEYPLLLPQSAGSSRHRVVSINNLRSHQTATKPLTICGENHLHRESSESLWGISDYSGISTENSTNQYDWGGKSACMKWWMIKHATRCFITMHWPARQNDPQLEKRADTCVQFSVLLWSFLVCGCWFSFIDANAQWKSYSANCQGWTGKVFSSQGGLGQGQKFTGRGKAGHLYSISLSNVSFCVPNLGTKNGTFALGASTNPFIFWED